MASAPSHPAPAPPGLSARSAQALERFAATIEHASALDAVADRIAGLVERVLPPGPVADAAAGVPAAHPAHPALVAVPVGAWASATALDLTGGPPAARRRLVLLGLLSAVPAALTGAHDWRTTAGAERRVGLVHAALNSTSLGCYAASWAARVRGRHGRGTVWALAGLGVTGAAGWLGGHLTYALGVGVDTTAFQHLPAEWTDACAETDVPARGTHGVQVAGVAVLLARVGPDIVALADRCTHRGAPLHEGEARDG